MDVLVDSVGTAAVLVDDHGHTLLAVVGLTTIDPDGLGIVDQDIVHRCKTFVTRDWNEAGFQTWARRSCQVASNSLARFSKAGFGDGVVLADVSGSMSWPSKVVYLRMELKLYYRADWCFDVVWEVLQRTVGVRDGNDLDNELAIASGRWCLDGLTSCRAGSSGAPTSTAHTATATPRARA